MNFIESKHREFTLSTDPSRLQLEVIHDYLSKESYWAQGRSKEIIARSIKHSLCFGVYKDGKQIGFARVITDFSLFAYILDLFILREFQGMGLGKWLVSSILSHPGLQGKIKWALKTKDAHGLYRQFKFSDLSNPENWMEKG